MPARTIVITGATGMLGAHLSDGCAARGEDVVAVSRTRPASGRVRWHPWTMPDDPPDAALQGADVVIHCAYETRSRDPRRAYEINVEGARRLLAAARRQGVARSIFISSLSAHAGAASAYGRSKLAVEGMLDPRRDLAIRPGLIVAPGGSGLYGRMRAVIARSRVVPLPYGGRQLIQTIAIDDLVEGILRAMDRGITGVLMIADPRPVPIVEMYRAMARAAGVRPIFVRVPGAPMFAALRAMERLGIRLPVTSENLLGLRHLRAFDVAGDLARIDLRPKPMAEAVAGRP